MGFKRKKEMALESDMLTDLPENVLDQILIRLPIRYAVRTSVLSSKWRYKWRTMSELVFNYRSARTSHRHYKSGIAEDIFRALLLHKGPVNKFELSTSCMLNYDSVESWVVFLNEKSVKELVFNFGLKDAEHYIVPTSLFSSQQICTLELHHCVLKPPRTFTGFHNLQSLYLRKVTFRHGVLECLISKCSLLERLTVENLEGVDHLKFCAPKLKNLLLSGNFKDISFVNTPLLSVVSITLDSKISERLFEQSCTFEKVLSSLPNIRKFVAQGFFLQLLTVCEIPEKLTYTYHHLVNIILDLNFEDPNQALATICLINSSPNLRELEILSFSGMGFSTVEIWDSHICDMNQLKVVKLTDIEGYPAEFSFIGFILARSPVLDKLSIRSSPYMEISSETLLTSLLRFRRASPVAELDYLGHSNEFPPTQIRKRWDDKE